MNQVFQKFYKIEGEMHLVIIAQVRPKKFDCHACQPLMAGAIFKQSGSDWQIIGKNLTITRVGSWGQLPNIIEMIQTGHNSYALVFLWVLHGSGIKFMDFYAWVKQ